VAKAILEKANLLIDELEARAYEETDYQPYSDFRKIVQSVYSKMLRTKK